MPGGLALIVVGVCALFTTFTGGSGVTIIAVGGLLYPMLKQDRYPEGFSLGLVTAAGSLGLLLPPSLPVILYSVVAAPGDGRSRPMPCTWRGSYRACLMVGIVAAYGMLVGRRVQQARPVFAWRELRVATWAAKWELLLPRDGRRPVLQRQDSMVETAAAALAFAVVTQCLITRDIPLRRLPVALTKAGA